MYGAASRAPWPKSAASGRSARRASRRALGLPRRTVPRPSPCSARARPKSVGRNTRPAANLPGAGRVTEKASLRDSRQKLERQRRDHARAVARVGLGAARAAVVHPAQQVVRVLDDLVAALTFDVRDEAHAAAVVLELRPIQPLSRREAGAVCFSHACRSSCRKSVHDATIGARPFGRAGSLHFRVSRSCSHGSIQRSAVGSAWLVFLAGWQFCDAGPVKPPAIRSAAERSYI